MTTRIWHRWRACLPSSSPPTSDLGTSISASCTVELLLATKLGNGAQHREGAVAARRPCDRLAEKRNEFANISRRASGDARRRAPLTRDAAGRDWDHDEPRSLQIRLHGPPSKDRHSHSRFHELEYGFGELHRDVLPRADSGGTEHVAIHAALFGARIAEDTSVAQLRRIDERAVRERIVLRHDEQQLVLEERCGGNTPVADGVAHDAEIELSGDEGADGPSGGSGHDADVDFRMHHAKSPQHRREPVIAGIALRRATQHGGTAVRHGAKVLPA